MALPRPESSSPTSCSFSLLASMQFGHWLSESAFTLKAAGTRHNILDCCLESTLVKSLGFWRIELGSNTLGAFNNSQSTTMTKLFTFEQILVSITPMQYFRVFRVMLWPCSSAF